MTRLRIGGQRIDADLALFDKDGTLIDFHRVWSARGLAAVSAMTMCADPQLRELMLEALGIDAARQRVDGGGVLAQLPHERIEAHCLAVLRQAGVARTAAEQALHEQFSPVMRAPPSPAEMPPLGDIAGLLGALHRAGVRCGVVTTDDREATLTTLAVLGVEALICEIACGDDATPAKPAPDGLLRIATALGIAPSRSLMVGDTLTDMRAGRAAGFYCVGVCSGGGNAEELAALADAVVATVHDIQLEVSG